MARNPIRDKVAVVGIGSTPYGRDLRRTALSLGLEAALKAIDDAGIDRHEIDGLCGSGMDPLAMGGAGFLSLQGALGIEKTTWVKNGWLGSSLFTRLKRCLPACAISRWWFKPICAMF